MRALVKKMVRLAFRVGKGVTTQVVFKQVTTRGFDFNNPSAQPVPTSIPIDAFDLGDALNNGKNGEGVAAAVTKVLLIDSNDIANVDVTDAVEINGVTWTVVPPVKRDEFLTEVTVTRRV